MVISIFALAQGCSTSCCRQADEPIRP